MSVKMIMSAKFKLGVANLGRWVPRLLRQQQMNCPLCPEIVPNTVIHLVCYCPSVREKRNETGISAFINQGLLRDFTMEEIYVKFVNCLDLHDNVVTRADSLERGRALQDLIDHWLSKW